MKSFVKNRAASEGCIAECYVGDEVVSFVERYYGQTMRNERLPRVDDNSNHISSNTLFPAIGKPVGACASFAVSLLLVTVPVVSVGKKNILDNIYCIN